jgi:formamidopyrimidine-DNA glycosylase
MPELPEVETACRGAKPFAENKIIKDIIVREKKLREYIPEEINTIIGTKIINIFRRAKYILIELNNNQHIIIHLGMSGSFTVQKKENEIKKHSHFEIILEDDIILRFNDPRKFGMVLLSDNYLDNKYIKNCGLEPFDEIFLNNYLYNLSRKKKMPIKNFIMKNDIVVGIGNIYASECLFKVGIRPDRPANEISKKEYLLLSKEVQKTLRDSISNGGTTLKDHQTGLGESGNFQNKLFVYGQKKCQVCQNNIEQIKQNGRTSFFCKKCQK